MGGQTPHVCLIVVAGAWLTQIGNTALVLA